MPEFPVPAVYLGFDVPAVVLVESAPFDEPVPAAPLFMPEPSVEGLTVKVVLGRAITREVIGCLESAVVDEWTEDVELLATDTATISASGRRSKASRQRSRGSSANTVGRVFRSAAQRHISSRMRRPS